MHYFSKFQESLIFNTARELPPNERRRQDSYSQVWYKLVQMNCNNNNNNNYSVVKWSDMSQQNSFVTRIRVNGWSIKVQDSNLMKTVLGQVSRFSCPSYSV